MKVLAMFLAGLIMVFPAFTQAAVAQTVPLQEQEAPNKVRATSVPLPEGRELGDEELSETDGEFFWFLAFAVIYGGISAIYHNWFDGTYGIDYNDMIDIAGTSLAAGIGGELLATTVAVYQAFK
jgi:hypothetical protein